METNRNTSNAVRLEALRTAGMLPSGVGVARRVASLCRGRDRAGGCWWGERRWRENCDSL